MSTNDNPQVNNVNSGLIDTEPTMPTPQALQTLPAELIGILAELLTTEDLLAMRTTCRELRNSSAFAFCQRFLDFVEIPDSSNGVRQLIAILTSPSLPHAQQTVRILVVSAPLLRSSSEYQHPTELEAIMSASNLPKEEQIIKRKNYEEPDAADVARLLRTMPKMTTLSLIGDANVLELLHEAGSAPVFLSCLAQLPQQLWRLDLFAVELYGDLLSNVLEAHKGALTYVSFNEVVLES